MKRPVALTAFGMMTAVAVLGIAHAQEPLDAQQLQELLHPFYQAEAARYDFTLDGTPATKLELERTPVMSWTGQESGLTSGDIFVWTRNGRAEVIGCIGSLPGNENDRLLFHEFHALTLEPLPALSVADLEWAPDKPGVDFREIRDAPPPAGRRQQRLLQMRSLARGFGARMEPAVGSNDHLRMMAQPIYRTDAPDNDSADGAIFAFLWTLGTDPELLLLIESRRTENGFRWFYSPVRFTFRTIALDHQGKEVWKAGVHNSYLLTREPYVTRLAGSTTIDELKNRAAGSSAQDKSGVGVPEPAAR